MTGTWDDFLREYATVIGYRVGTGLGAPFIPIRPGDTRVQRALEQCTHHAGRPVVWVYDWKPQETA